MSAATSGIASLQISRIFAALIRLCLFRKTAVNRRRAPRRGSLGLMSLPRTLRIRDQCCALRRAFERGPGQRRQAARRRATRMPPRWGGSSVFVRRMAARKLDELGPSSARRRARERIRSRSELRPAPQSEPDCACSMASVSFCRLSSLCGFGHPEPSSNVSDIEQMSSRARSPHERSHMGGLAQNVPDIASAFALRRTSRSSGLRLLRLSRSPPSPPRKGLRHLAI
jgi:hypothetical protein